MGIFWLVVIVNKTLCVHCLLLSLLSFQSLLAQMERETFIAALSSTQGICPAATSNVIFQRRADDIIYEKALTPGPKSQGLQRHCASCHPFAIGKKYFY
jgi:hypothetical protein